VPTLRRAIELAPMDVEERRARMMGDFYTSLCAIPRDRSAAILLLGRDALDRGVFVNYYLYSTPARLYQDRLPTHAAASVVAVGSDGPVRRTVVAHPPPPEAPRRFRGPFAASVFGHDSYAIEAVIEGDTPVTLTLMPFGVKKTVAPPYAFSDVVQEMLGRRGTGWLRVESAGRVRASFWLVARADARATPLPLLTGEPPLRQVVRGARLFLVNPSDRPVTVHVNGHAESLAPHEIRETRGDAENVIEGEAFVWSTP
jgi:hypothetical protein